MIELGHFAGLRLTAKRSALIGVLGVWVALSLLGWRALGFPPGAALLGGLVATALHWLGDLVHHLGHAWAARRTGYPMIGVAFWGVLGSSIYPRDEPPLPARVHIQRALGGPLASLIFGLLAALVAWLLQPDGLAWWLAVFCAFQNLVLYAGQVLLPLGFNDGGTILYWLRRG